MVAVGKSFGTRITIVCGFAFVVNCNHRSKSATPQALIEASAVGSVVDVDMCLNGGVSPNVFFRSRSPLIAAAANSRIEAIHRLCDRGADVNLASASGSTPLSVAVSRSSSAELVEFLLKRGANPNPRNGSRDPLSSAVFADNLVFVALLLKYHADPNFIDAHGETPLTFARSAKAVTLLVGAGAKVNSVDNEGRTPLFAMAGSGSSAAISALIHLGGDPCAVSRDGCQALSWAIEFFDPDRQQNYIDSIALLKCKHANLNVKNSHGKSIIDLANKLRNAKVSAALGLK